MIDLRTVHTRAPKILDKEKIKEETVHLLEKMEIYHRIMFAQDKHSMLIVLQGMDGSGKDGATKRVFSGLNPMACKVSGFKKPTSKEADHDFLRRIHQKTPGKGEIMIFNRSHYEDLLVPGVEGYVSRADLDKRAKNINNFEELLTDHNTKVLKFYLHVSRDRQMDSLTDRLKDPTKHWKHNDGDWKNTDKREKYIDEYHKVFEQTSTPHSPWHIISADQNRYKTYQIAKIIVDEFESMDLERPGLDTELKVDDLIEQSKTYLTDD